MWAVTEHIRNSIFTKGVLGGDTHKSYSRYYTDTEGKRRKKYSVGFWNLNVLLPDNFQKRIEMENAAFDSCDEIRKGTFELEKSI